MGWGWVDRLINSNGDNIVLNEVTQSNDIDIDTGDFTKTVTPHPMIAVMTDYRSSELVDGVINMGDVSALIKTDLIPEKSWTVTYQADTYNVMNIRRVSTQNTIVTYRLQLRK